ncbi:hypothetical protein TI39_contig850g00010 [Zymoseptoria brevis]|uniref:Uncharacterized protein n=1 Tax=Zymoseptoria brevis TaxID=1047168 RepID=A0A0F4GG63_9PEZI|nr:hypothetical protein TI39_contig850g00010 [Zymoseptoria brevis]
MEDGDKRLLIFCSIIVGWILVIGACHLWGPRFRPSPVAICPALATGSAGTTIGLNSIETTTTATTSNEADTVEISPADTSRDEPTSDDTAPNDTTANDATPDETATDAYASRRRKSSAVPPHVQPTELDVIRQARIARFDGQRRPDAEEGEQTPETSRQATERSERVAETSEQRQIERETSNTPSSDCKSGKATTIPEVTVTPPDTPPAS